MNRTIAAAAALLFAAASASAQTVNANECANATVISGTGIFNFSTTGATRSTNPSMFTGCYEMDRDVWARWTAPQTGWATLSTCVGSTQFSLIAVYQGGDCANLLPIACGSREPGCPLLADAPSFWAEAGQVYTFRLDAAPGASQFSLSYSEPFPGDDCHNALPITGVGVFPFDNSGATSSYNAADPFQYAKNDVWYRWTATASGPTYITTCGHMTIFPFIQLFEADCPVGAFPIVSGGDAPGCPGAARIDFEAIAGTEYLLRIGCPNDETRIVNGSFEIVHVGGGGGGEIITVTTVADIVDFGGSQNVAALPGPDGRVSFREAILAANNTPGPQSIHFAIPTTEFDPFIPGVAVLRLERTSWVVTGDNTTIDFSTQTANIGDTNPDGPEVEIFGYEPNSLGVAAIFLNANDCVIKGLGAVRQRGYAVEITGNRNRVIGCQISGPLHAAVLVSGGFFGPPATDNIIGGTEPGEGNFLTSLGAGLRIDGAANNNRVIGNVLTGRNWGVEVRGALGYAAPVGNIIGGPTDAERNIIAGAGRYGEEGFPVGGQVNVEWATDTLVENNYIGTTPDGSAAASPQYGPHGVRIFHATGTTVRGNLISGIAVNGINHAAGQRFGTPIFVTGTSSNTLIQGNRIGTDANGEHPIPNRTGIDVAPSTISEIPTATTIDANVIAFNERTGVAVAAQVTDVRITGNSIHSNGLLGIDLQPAFGNDGGVTPNDPDDADAGGNGLQNFPVLTSAAAGPTSIRIAGILNSAPGQTYAVEFFASSSCDPSGHGEGAVFLGSAAVTTSSAGDASFNVTLPVFVAPGEVITATATRADIGATSEFSACIAADVGSPCPADWNGDGGVNSADISAYLTAWLDSLNDGTLVADVNGDNVVNSIDISAFLVMWVTAAQDGC